jgi:hypothetical protein
VEEQIFLKELSMPNILTIIDSRPDGSFIYNSHKGVLNLDTVKNLNEAIQEDLSFIQTAGLSRLSPSEISAYCRGSQQ